MEDPADTTIQKFSQAAPWTILARVVIALSGVILAAKIPNYYEKDAETYAIYELLKWVVLATPFMFGLGLEKVIPRFLPELIHRGNPKAVRRLLWGALGLLAIALVVEAALLVWGGSYYESSKAVELSPYFWVLISLVALWLYRTILFNICVSRFDTFIVSIANLISCPIWVGLTFLFLDWGWGLRGVFGAQAISVAIQLAFMLGRQYRFLLHGKGEEFEEPGSGESEAPVGIQASRLSRLIVPTLVSNLQFVIISLPGELLFTFLGISGFKDTANYGLAYGLSYFAMGIFVPPIYTLAVASFSHFYVKDPQKLRQGIRYFYKLLFTLLVPIATMGVLLGDKALILLVGSEYAHAGSLIRIFAVYHVYGTIFIPITVALVTMEKWMVMVPINICQIISILALNFLLIPSMGVEGAMISKFGTVLVGSGVTLWIASRAIGGLDIPIGFLGKCVLASSSAFLLYPLRSYVDTEYGLVALVVAAGGLMVFAMRQLRLLEAEDARLLARSGSPLARLTLGILVKK